MKKKIALLLAAIMLFAVAIPSNVFAANLSQSGLTKNYAGNGDSQLITTNVTAGDQAALADIGAASGASYLNLFTSGNVKVGETYKVTLTNAVWAFSDKIDTEWSRVFNRDASKVNSAAAVGAPTILRSYDENFGLLYTETNFAGAAGPDGNGHYFNALGAATVAGNATEIYQTTYNYYRNYGDANVATQYFAVKYRMTFSVANPNEATIVVVDYATGKVKGEAGVVDYTSQSAAVPNRLSIPMVFIVDDEEVDVTVKVTNADTSLGTAFDTATATVVAAPSAAVVSIAQPPVSSRDQFTLKRVTVSEKASGQLNTTGTLLLIAPAGYKWGTMTPYNATTNPTGFRMLADGGFQSIIPTPAIPASIAAARWIDLGDGRGIQEVDPNTILEINYAITTLPGSTAKGSFYVDGLVLNTVDSNVPFEDVTIFATDYSAINVYTSQATATIGAWGGDVNTGVTGAFEAKNSTKFNSSTYADRVKDLLAATRVDYKILFDLVSGQKVKEVYAGAKDVVTPKVYWKENTPLSWWAHNTTDWVLVDEEGNSLAGMVKFQKVDITARTNFQTTLPTIVGTYNGGLTAAGADTSYVKLTDNMLTMEHYPIANDKKGGIEFVATISVCADYEGPVYLQGVETSRAIPSGLNPEKVKIAEVKAPVVITTKTKNIEVGYQTIAVEDVTVTENGTGVYRKGFNVEVRIEAFGAGSPDIYFIDVKNVGFKQTAGDGIVGKPTNISAGTSVIQLPVTRASVKTPNAFTLSNLKVYVNRAVPEGKYDVAVGGNAFVYNFGTAVQVQTKCLGYFEVFGVTSPEYIIAATPGLNKALSQNIELATDGTGNMIVDKTPTVLEYAPYINASTGRTMYPIKFIALALGLEEKNVIWDGKDRKVTIVTAERTVEFFVGQSLYTINGANQYMEAGVKSEINPANDRAYAPIAYIAKALGVTVAWNGTTKMVYLNPTKEQINNGAVITTVANDIQ